MEQKHLEKIAKMIVFGVPQNQIATACGISESRISQIKDTEEYKLAEQVVASEQFEEEQLINQGWDGVEALGINRVVQALKNNPEPEFALKAAAIANKAVRRGKFRNNPIAQSAGVKAVINLNQTFVNRVNKDSNDMIEHLNANKKTTNFLAPDKVQALLMTDSATGEAMAHRVENAITTPQTESLDEGILDSLNAMELDTLS